MQVKKSDLKLNCLYYCVPVDLVNKTRQYYYFDSFKSAERFFNQASGIFDKDIIFMHIILVKVVSLDPFKVVLDYAFGEYLILSLN